MLPYKLIRPFIFKMEPEAAHGMTIKALKTGAIKACRKKAPSESLRQKLFGLEFSSPLGMAAGFDKNAEVIAPILKLGFGFAEAGTVTPKPQAGNPQPRIFRCPEHKAVINRMGFPNGGLRVFKPNIRDFLGNAKRPAGVLGINIGMNKDQATPEADYCALIEELAPLANYLTVNISSPNTPGLRDLQQKDTLYALIMKMKETLAKTCPDNAPALLIKLAPDLSEEQQKDIAETLVSAKVDGVILSNTTLDRPDYLPETFRAKPGGLSGEPVREKSTSVIANFYKLTKGELPIIGVGGISNAQHAYEKIKAGASLVQLYSGMIYEGPEIAQKINADLAKLLEADGYSNITEAIGAAHR